jgi:hypothetical protein
VREKGEAAKVWITKYALSGGITEHECEPPREGNSCVFPGNPFFSFTAFKLGTEAHTSLEEAVKFAEKMRMKKIAAMRRQIEKLEAMKF